MNHHLHALYGRTFRIKRWFASRFTRLGRHMLLLAGLGLLFGINVPRTMIYQIFMLTTSLLLLSFALTLRFTSGLRVIRSLPPTCVAGRELTYRIVVENHGAGREEGILYRESVRHHVPGWQEFVSSPEEGEERRNVFDRKMGYYRWLWLVRKGRVARQDDQLLPVVPSSRSREIEVTLLPERRGSVHIDGYILSRVDPFGLCRREIRHGESCNLLVLPKIYDVPPLFAKGARKYHQGGLSSAQERGDSSEFFSLRDYLPGDAPKSIDWKATARLAKPIVRQCRDEYFTRYGLILDSFTASRYSQVFEEAVSLAASILLSHRDLASVLDLLFIENECVSCTVGSARDCRRRMLEMLASASTCADRSFGELAALVRSHAALLSGAALLLIDLDDERLGLVRYLLSHALPTRILLIVDSVEAFTRRRGPLPDDLPLEVLEVGYMEEQIARL